MRKLRRLRAEKGLTMDALEVRTGVSKRTISEIERGMRAPQILTLAKLAGALGVDVDELVEEGAPKAPRSSPIAAEDPAGEERRRTEKALETLADLVASRMQEIVDSIDKSQGKFPLQRAVEVWEEEASLRHLHSKEPHTIQNAPRVREAMEILDSANHRLNEYGELWRRLRPDQWSHRAAFTQRSAESQHNPEVEEEREEKATGDGA